VDERVDLPDGSYAIVEPITKTSALISRVVDGEVVWGQAFGHATEWGRVRDEVLARMREHPERHLSARRRGVW